MEEVKTVFGGKRIIAILPAFNEENYIVNVIKRVPLDLVDEVLVVDDGSGDRTAEMARGAGARVINFSENKGVGAALRCGFKYAQENCYDIIVILAANGKDNPQEIINLIKPLVERHYDFIQGSRYLGGGCYSLPFYRIIATKLHALFFSFICKKKLTDSTNGFRAFNVRILRDSRIRLEQSWLDRYGLEYYLYYKALTLGFKAREIAVSKIYPDKKRNYTKIRPIIDWWNIIKILALLKIKN